MSNPFLPNTDMMDNLEHDKVLNLLLTSIALEEIALGQVISAEADNIRSFLGKWKGASKGTAKEVMTVDHLLKVNRAANQTLGRVIQKELLLLLKLEDILEFAEGKADQNDTCTCGNGKCRSKK